MRMFVHVLLIAALACGLTACGNKGKLKSPTQIRIEEAKKASKKPGAVNENPPAPADTLHDVPPDTGTPKTPPVLSSGDEK